jgi:hypothetical protein
LAGESSHEIVALAARSRHDVVRVSAASVAASLPTPHAVEITTMLSRDPDPGVRGRAAKSAAKIGNKALTQVTELRGIFNYFWPKIDISPNLMERLCDLADVVQT